MLQMTDRTAGAPLNTYGGAERRRQERLNGPFCARVMGVDRDGRAFDVKSTVENISAGGLYLRLPRTVEPGARLSATIFFSEATDGARAKCLAAQGRVGRADALPDGASGVAVEFAHSQFL